MAQEKPIEYHIEKIKELHAKKVKDPYNEKIDKELYTQLSQWEKKLSKIACRPNNEQTPWTVEELRKGKPGKKGVNGKPDTKDEILNWSVITMPLKKDSGYLESGDYMTVYKGGGVEGIVRVVIERKGGIEGKGGPHDLYASIGAENRINLYEEAERVSIDPRFDDIIMIAECSQADLNRYVPIFNGKLRNYNHIKMSNETQDATIAGLYIRGMPVWFAGSREKAIKAYRNIVRQWIMKNYVKILKLDGKLDGEIPPSPDALRARLSVLNTEIKEIKAQLKNIKSGCVTPLKKEATT